MLLRQLLYVNGVQNMRANTRLFLLLRSKRMLIFGLFVLLLVSMYFMRLDTYINFVQLKTHRDYLAQLVHSNYYSAVVVYIFAYIVIVALSFPFLSLIFWPV